MGGKGAVLGEKINPDPKKIRDLPLAQELGGKIVVLGVKPSLIPKTSGSPLEQGFGWKRSSFKQKTIPDPKKLMIFVWNRGCVDKEPV